VTVVASPPFDLPDFILGIRPDLHVLFPASDKRRRENFVQWLLTTGVLEYAAVGDGDLLPQNLARRGYGPGGCLTLLQQRVRAVRADVRKVFPLPRRLKDFEQWFYTHGLEELHYWRLLSPEERRLVLALPEPWASRLRDVIVAQLPVPRHSVPLDQRPFGMNVVGYAYGQLGIGEDARMAARSLLAAGVPATMVNVEPGSDIPQNDRSMAAHVELHGRHAINLFCITAEETGRIYAEQGNVQFRDRYNIGYWPWELPKWPALWQMVIDLVDEVWVSTQHTYDALKPVCDKPLQLMPMAVELGEVRRFASKAQARRHFGLPEQPRLFCFAFDLNSWVQRKNPQACLDAFLAAFPRKRFGPDKVGLVIKVGRPPARRNQLWNKLKKLAAQDDRIHIIEVTLPRPDLLALYKACDCYISLHRAEGFGRGMAEALQLGLHVICTGYSGNVDFCTPPNAQLVRYQLVKVRKSEYVHTQGQVWADPDVQHAASLMRKFVTAPAAQRRKRWTQFEPATVGKRYQQRLEEIMANLREPEYYALCPRREG